MMILDTRVLIRIISIRFEAAQTALGQVEPGVVHTTLIAVCEKEGWLDAWRMQSTVMECLAGRTKNP